MNTLFCPCCGAENPLERSVCQKCKADLGVVKSILDTANLHYNRALTLAGEGRYPEAELEATAALELYNKNPRYHNLLGTIYARQGKFNRAQEAWETTLYLEEDTSSAYRSLQRLQRLSSNGTLEAPRRRTTSVFDVLLLLLLVFFGWMAHHYYVEQLVNDYELRIQSRDAERSAEQQLGGLVAASGSSSQRQTDMEELLEEIRQYVALMQEQTAEMRAQATEMRSQAVEMQAQYDRLRERLVRDASPEAASPPPPQE
ncbi:hypothetical protein HS125_16880 [bacterium]|nr:hypothetical protein [bacterium]